MSSKGAPDNAWHVCCLSKNRERLDPDANQQKRVPDHAGGSGPLCRWQTAGNLTRLHFTSSLSESSAGSFSRLPHSRGSDRSKSAGKTESKHHRFCRSGASKLIAQAKRSFHKLQALSGILQLFPHILSTPRSFFSAKSVSSIAQGKRQAAAKPCQLLGMLTDALGDLQEELLGIFKKRERLGPSLSGPEGQTCCER